MSHMENRYHKVVGLDLVINWSRKKCGELRSVRALTDPLIHWHKNSRINYWNQNSRIPCKSAFLFFFYFIFFILFIYFFFFFFFFLISIVPHLGVRENNHLFRGFLKNWELNVERAWWLTKHGPLTDSWTYNLLTIGRLHNKKWTDYSWISWQTTDLQFTDLTNHGPISYGLENRNNVTLWITWRYIVIDTYMYVEVIQLYIFLKPILMM